MPSPKRARKASNAWNKLCPLTCLEVDETNAVQVGNELVSATGLLFFITRSGGETIPFTNTTSIVSKVCLQRALAKIPIELEKIEHIPASKSSVIASAEVIEPLQCFWIKTMQQLKQELDAACKLGSDEDLVPLLQYVFHGARFFSHRNRLEGRDQIKALHAFFQDVLHGDMDVFWQYHPLKLTAVCIWIYDLRHLYTQFLDQRKDVLSDALPPLGVFSEEEISDQADAIGMYDTVTRNPETYTTSYLGEIITGLLTG